MSLIIDALEDMQLLITSKDAVLPPGILTDTKLIKMLQIFDVISSANLSCGKIPQPDIVDTCRDVLDIALDCLESRETFDSVLTQLEQLRFLLSQPHFQVRNKFCPVGLIAWGKLLSRTPAVSKNKLQSLAWRKKNS